MRKKDCPSYRNKENNKIERSSNSLSKYDSVELGERHQDRQLYQLCQQLTKDNRLLRKEVNDLRKTLQQSNGNVECQCVASKDNNEYRSNNYESYKRKAMQMLSSVKFLHKLYNQRQKIEKRNNIIDNFMLNIKNGQNNTIDELVKIFNEQIRQQQESPQWDIEQYQQYSSQYQNNLLRKHVIKLNNILVDNLYLCKININQIKEDFIHSQEKISQQLKYYCGKYINFKGEQLKQISQISNKSKIKKGKKLKSSQAQNINDKSQWEKVKQQRLKIKEQRYSQPLNVFQSLEDSLAMSVPQNYTLPIYTKPQSKPPLPKSSSHLKHVVTIADQLQISKLSGHSRNTPKNNANRNSQSLKDSSIQPSNQKRQRTPSWKNYKDNNINCYYR